MDTVGEDLGLPKCTGCRMMSNWGGDIEEVALRLLGPFSLISCSKPYLAQSIPF